MKIDPAKWYFKTYAYIIAFLCVGPIALPLVWLNPNYTKVKKTVITVITLIVTYFMAVVFFRSAESIFKYYQQALQLSK